MSKTELARKLAEMTRSMERARAARNAKTKKISHQTNPAGWNSLKKVLDYVEPSLEEKDS